MAALAFNTEQHRIAIVRSGVAGWLLLVLEYGAYVYLLPHGQHFAGDVGKFTAWLVFSTIFTLWYLPVFAFMALVSMLLVRNEAFSRSSSWLLPLIGGFAFAMIAMIVSILRIKTALPDVVFIAVLFAIAGAVSMAVLRSNLKLSVGKSPYH